LVLVGPVDYQQVKAQTPYSQPSLLRVVVVALDFLLLLQATQVVLEVGCLTQARAALHQLLLLVRVMPVAMLVAGLLIMALAVVAVLVRLVAQERLQQQEMVAQGQLHL
jgi:hypothetical protein